MSQMGHEGGAPSRWAIFCNFLEKNGYFNAIWITFRTVSEPFERTKFLMFKSQLKKSLPLFQVKSKTRFKSCILGLNFVTWPKSGKSRYILFATFLALNNALEDLPLKILFCHENNQFYRNICTTRGLGTLDSNSIICSISISPN